MARKLWTTSDKKLLETEFPNINTKTLAKRMGRSYSSVAGMANIMGIKKSPEYIEKYREETTRNLLEGGVANRFKKGQKSWNKGMKGLQMGGVQSQFKPGHKPHNWKPIGSEIITKDGYIEVKYKDERKAVSNYMLKHRLVWEREKGKVPDGYVLSFKDGNTRNCDLDNLYLVSKVDKLNTNRFSDSGVAKRYLGVRDNVEEFIEGNKELLEVKRLEIKLIEKINKHERSNKKI